MRSPIQINVTKLRLAGEIVWFLFVHVMSASITVCDTGEMTKMVPDKCQGQGLQNISLYLNGVFFVTLIFELFVVSCRLKTCLF